MIAGTPPTDAGFTSALAEARRRRWNSLAAGAAAATVLAIVAAAAPSFRPSASQDLGVTNPAPGASPSAGAWYLPDAPQVQADPQPSAAPQARRPATGAAASPSPARMPEPRPSPRLELWRGPMTGSARDQGINNRCGLIGWYCTFLHWDGETRTMAFEFCDRYEPEQARLAHYLNYTTKLETDFVIEGPHGFRWQWSNTQTFPAEQRQRGFSNSCFTWSTIWDLIGDDGRETPNGAYRMTVISHANELRGVRWTKDFVINYQH